MLKYLAAGKILKKHNARVDNMMFHLHYRATFIIFIVSSALITAKEYFGNPIECYALKSAVPRNVLNTYCFIMNTYSVSKHNTSSPYVVYPGVGPEKEGDERVYHSYYQWVPVVLFLQGISFYLPRFLWKSFDAGLFSSVLMGLDKACLDTTSIKSKCATFSAYFFTHLNMHRNWAIRFFVCELMCLIVVISNIYATDQFLGGTFIEYGSEVFKFAEADSSERQDAMDRIFPRVTKCTFRKFGTSGSVEKHESMCVLPANILNVKIYIFLWYWLMVLAVVTALWLVYRILVLVSSGLRTSLLNYRGRLAGREVVSSIGQRLSIGDWFMLYQIGSWMHPLNYGGLLRTLHRELENEQYPMPSAPSLESKPLRGS